MKVKHPLYTRQARCSVAGLFLVLLVAAVVFWPQNAAGQQPALKRLTLLQIEGLVAHGVPDSTMFPVWKISELRLPRVEVQEDTS
jgi:hypothetical protein